MGYTHAISAANETQQPQPKQAKQARQLERLFLTADEVAYMIGMKRSFIFEQAAKREIPSVRFGRAVRFPYAEIMTWITQVKREAGVEVEG